MSLSSLKVMTWFENLTGCSELSANDVRKQLVFDGPHLRSCRNGKSWLYGELEMPTLAQLRKQVKFCVHEPRPLSLREIIADVQQLHRDATNQQALFQVVSQYFVFDLAWRWGLWK